jgi:hypothetical protein
MTSLRNGGGDGGGGADGGGGDRRCEGGGVGGRDTVDAASLTVLADIAVASECNHADCGGQAEGGYRAASSAAVG